jgi:hypothetical protein
VPICAFITRSTRRSESLANLGTFLYINFEVFFSSLDRLPAPLSHLPYLKTLPGTEQLLTPLHFTSDELDAFKGTNIHRATLDRLQAWKDEWQQCVDLFARSRQDLCSEITWHERSSPGS